jgi:DNA-binding transcriptional regulator YiaG
MSPRQTNLSDRSSEEHLVKSLLKTTNSAFETLLSVVKSKRDFELIERALSDYEALLAKKEQDILEEDDLDQILAEVEGEETVSHEEVLSQAFNNNIKAIRKRVGMPQVELAEKLGKKPSEISRWESGTVTPSMKNMRLISQALNCSLEDLLS